MSVGGTRFEAARVLFVDSSTSATSSFASRVVASDLDGDGDVDLALSLVDDSSSGATSSGATSSVNGGRLVLLQSMLGFAPPTQAPSPLPSSAPSPLPHPHFYQLLYKCYIL